MTTAIQYKILAGDTLNDLATKFDDISGVTWQEIAAANPDVNPKYLQVGEVINIPPVGGSDPELEFTVLSGYTYSLIADDLKLINNLTASDIEAANPGINAQNPQVGQVINIPAAETSSTATATEVGQSAEAIGYYAMTWSSATPPTGTNIGVAFSGWTDPSSAISNSNNVFSSLVGAKYICLGGGNSSGSWSADALTTAITAINNGDFSKYDGVAFDIEEGDSGLEEAFANAFSAVKSQNMKVLVTISHSAPFGVTDAATLMQSFFSSDDIDYLSPQLYTTGQEAENDYAISQGVTWQSYVDCKAPVIPSIVCASYYPSAVEYYGNIGLALGGFIQWKQSC